MRLRRGRLAGHDSFSLGKFEGAVLWFPDIHDFPDAASLLEQSRDGPLGEIRAQTNPLSQAHLQIGFFFSLLISVVGSSLNGYDAGYG